MRYNINEGKKTFAVRLGCEPGLYAFIDDYANDMGMTRSGVVRRLLLIGARCEFEHGNRAMPSSYNNLQTGPLDATRPLWDIFAELADDNENGKSGREIERDAS